MVPGDAAQDEAGGDVTNVRIGHVTCLSSTSNDDLERLAASVVGIKRAVVRSWPMPWSRDEAHLRSWWNAAEGLMALVKAEACWRGGWRA